MKKALIILCSIIALTACQKETDKIKLISPDHLEFSSEGGTGEIIFEITNSDKTIPDAVFTPQKWIHFETADNTIFFTVDPNTSEEERTGEISIMSKSDKVSVTISQSGCENMTTFTATTLAGSGYYGIYESSTGYNYYVIMSTAGITDNGTLQSNSTYYYFDIYSDTPAQGNTITIPAGEYTLQNNTNPGSINPQYSNLTLTSESSYEEFPYTEAKMTVSANSIEAYVTLESGEVHHIIYNGAPVFSGSGSSEGVSTLTGDHSFDIENGVFVGAYVGDLLYTGCNTCQVYLFEYLDEITGEERGDQFQLDLQLPVGGTDICGTYTPGTTEGHFIPGYADNSSGQYLQQHTWYMTAGYIDFAPMVSGTITVSKDANDVYTFDIDCLDDRGNRIYGTFKGEGPFIEW